MANYTKKDVLELDAKTIDFCERWIWDCVKRFRMTDNTGKNKATREAARNRTDGMANACDMLEVLRNYNKTGDMCESFTLWDEDLPRRAMLNA